MISFRRTAFEKRLGNVTAVFDAFIVAARRLQTV
jgi:hypothetical protein